MAIGVTAQQVGVLFVQKYYHVLRVQPRMIYRFYSIYSAMIRVDGDDTKTAYSLQQIQALVMSLNFVMVEIKTINSLYCMDRSVVLMLSGFVKISGVNGMRKFVQTVFLARYGKGYYVLTDIFQFIDDGVTIPNPEPVPRKKIQAQPHTCTFLTESPDNGWDISKYIDSVLIEDDPADQHILPEQQLHQNLKTEVVVEETPLKEETSLKEETPIKEASPSIPNAARPIHETPVAHEEEPLEEAPKKTYASVLLLPKRQAMPSVALRRSNKVTSILAEDKYNAQPAVQRTSYASMNVRDSGIEAADESYELEEGEFKIFVKNLPASVTKAEIEQEFEIFGKIRPDGIFIKLRKEIGACYAFVEFEEIVGVQNSLQASPIKLAGRQVYIEEWRPTGGGFVARERRRGKGGSGYPIDAPKESFGPGSLGRGNN